ncbi:MAG TPA: hypothetical protein VFC23_01420 [Thermoanaerobaculia bacterium]|nr:hypothetical protein [Thermoanaerobaculia bacterium]
MNELSVSHPPRNLPVRLLVPLGALAAMASFAGRDTVPAGTAEGLYLAVLAAAALLPVGWLAPAPAVELGLGAVLATAAVWALPPGPGRGAAVVLVLAATLAVAAARRLVSDSLSPVSPGVLIPLALGVQALLRGELLLAPALTVRLLVALLVLPVAGALAVAMLARRHGPVLPLVAAGVALALAPGFNVATTLALLALAAGDALGRPDVGWQTARPARGLALAVVLAPIAWQPGYGVAVAVCGLALAWPRVGLGLAVAVAIGLGIVFKPPLSTMVLHLSALPLLVPAALLPERQRSWNVLAAAVLAATVPLVPDLSTLAAPLALAALSPRRSAAFTVPQRVWTGALLGGTALFASYPWLRHGPLTQALALLGLPPGPELAVWTAAVFLALAGLGVWMGRDRSGWSETLRSTRLAGLSAACLILALLQVLPRAGTPLLALQVPVVLDAGHPAWETDLPPQPVKSVVVDSTLGNGAGLPPGTPVAVLRLVGPAGRSVERSLRAGEDTGDWAARRPDVVREGQPAPAAWISWVAGDFFAQRYRSRLQLDGPDRPVHLRIERAPGAPPDLTVTLYQLELRK